MKDKIEETLEETLSPKYFPTSQFDNNFSDEEFKELQYLFEKIAEEIEPILPAGRYSVSTNLGRGGIAFVPWIGIHSTDPNFDSSSNEGFYLTILWKYDGTGVCLSFQKGTDGIQGANKTRIIQKAVSRKRKKYGTAGFKTSINLGHHTGRPKAYQQAHICGREYDLNSLTDLPDDLLKIEKLYDNVVNKRVKRKHGGLGELIVRFFGGKP